MEGVLTVLSIVVVGFVIVVTVPLWSALLDYLWEKQEDFIRRFK